MGIWKVNCAVRVPVEIRAALEEFAKREKRTLGNLNAVLIEWGLTRLRKPGAPKNF